MLSSWALLCWRTSWQSAQLGIGLSCSITCCLSTLKLFLDSIVHSRGEYFKLWRWNRVSRTETPSVFVMPDFGGLPLNLALWHQPLWLSIVGAKLFMLGKWDKKGPRLHSNLGSWMSGSLCSKSPTYLVACLQVSRMSALLCLGLHRTQPGSKVHPCSPLLGEHRLEESLERKCLRTIMQMSNYIQKQLKFLSGMFCHLKLEGFLFQRKLESRPLGSWYPKKILFHIKLWPCGTTFGRSLDVYFWLSFLDSDIVKYCKFADKSYWDFFFFFPNTWLLLCC